MRDETEFLLVVMIVGAMLSVSILDEGYAEHKNYCELVSMWEEDAKLGIEQNKRDGMPNYKEIDCEL